jgi:glyoxylase I family protein
VTTPTTASPSPPALLHAGTVHHLAIVVADLDRAEAFYRGVLGLEVVARHVDAAGVPRAVWVRLGTGFLALERAARTEPVRVDEAPGLHCLALAISPASREVWRAHLFSTGYSVERESPFTLYVRDPDGCLVALSHHPTPADL